MIKESNDKPEIVDWERLTKDWQKKKLAMIEAENELDAEMWLYLENKGAKPSQDSLDNVDTCRRYEYEARGLLNQLITQIP
jgi:hypothetical protein